MKKSNSNTIPILATLILAGSLIFFSFRYLQLYPPPPSLTGSYAPPPLPSPPDVSELKAPSTETLTSPMATFGTMSAYGATWDNKNVLVLKVSDSKTAITYETKNMDGTPRGVFSKVTFSPLGNYLFYLEEYREGIGGKIYDIKNKKIVLTTEVGNFNPSETLYYSCYIDNFAGGAEARVYQVPGFTIKLDFLKNISTLSGYQNLTCTTNVTSNVLQFVFSGSGVGQENSTVPIINKTYNVNLTTGELQSVQ